MGQPCYTKLGYCLDDDLLERTVHTEVGHNYFRVDTVWRMKEDLIVNGECVASAGEIMRQDAAPSVLAGPGQHVLGGKLNG